jgi:DNA-binding SARP family transcriptional activator
MILAEAARISGQRHQAVARLLEHAEYIRTESANLVIAFYVRAFPGLLGLLAEAVGADRLPVHLLRLINREESEEALREAVEDMPREAWESLAHRMLEPEEVDRLRESLNSEVPCYVRLFGGLEVTTPDGQIPDRAWRKRKARLLFAMLVAKQGQDVPREQILDHLWPDLDDERARNNFYVVWNTLKGALSPNLPKGENCPFVESVGGLCRVTPGMVRSDLDDFVACLAEARDAEDDDPEAAIAALQRLHEIYRGDLLPGDIYDDWFASLRERCRQQFGDAMLKLAQLQDQRDSEDGTLHALRRGLEHDPLREDLYRELLRCQIEAGMRSAAIETYMACRSRLSEELGLDPSIETRSLYDQVLAMEEGPSEAG